MVGWAAGELGPDFFIVKAFEERNTVMVRRLQIITKKVHRASLRIILYSLFDSRKLCLAEEICRDRFPLLTTDFLFMNWFYQQY